MSNYIFVEKPNPGKCPAGTLQKNVGDTPACQSSCGNNGCSGYPGVGITTDNKIQFKHKTGTFTDPSAVYFSKQNGKCVMWSTDPNGKRVSTEVSDQDCCDGNGRACRAGTTGKVLLASYTYDCNDNCETGCDPKNRKGCCLRGSDKCSVNPGGKYKCMPKEGCVIRPDGTYDTEAECKAKETQCGATRPDRWSCDGQGNCIKDYNGDYSTIDDCKLQCVGKPSSDTGNTTVKVLVGIAVVIAMVIVLLIVYTFILPLFRKTGSPYGNTYGSPMRQSAPRYSPKSGGRSLSRNF